MKGIKGIVSRKICNVGSFVSSDRSSYSDSVLLEVCGSSHFLRFQAFLPIYIVFLFENLMTLRTLRIKMTMMTLMTPMTIMTLMTLMFHGVPWCSMMFLFLLLLFSFCSSCCLAVANCTGSRRDSDDKAKQHEYTSVRYYQGTEPELGITEKSVRGHPCIRYKINKSQKKLNRSLPCLRIF